MTANKYLLLIQSTILFKMFNFKQTIMVGYENLTLKHTKMIARYSEIKLLTIVAGS